MFSPLQCIENEKQNKILQSQRYCDCYLLHVIDLCLFYLVLISQGEPVELNSKFIRYSTFRSGKEQLVNNLIYMYMHLSFSLSLSPGQLW